LLIATGAESAIPPIENLRSATNVYGLRNLADAKAIAGDASRANNIVVIGAGLVGMAAAYSLSKMGKKPTIIEIADHILPVNLDAHAAANYQKEFEKAGCVFRLGNRVNKVTLNYNGAINEVALSSGETIPCDLVVVATSIRPAVDFLKTSGLDVSNGVVVDQHLRAGNGIYAAGDVTGLSGTWSNAMNQGEVAAMNMCGVPTVYSDVFSLKSTMNFFGIKTLAVGVHTPSDDEESFVRESRDRYEKIVLKNDTPIGIILQGNIARGGVWQHMIKNKINVADIPKPIWKISFADAYGTTESGEFEWTV
jgi:NAD(P)H-nitrite reductase large subunit